MKFTKSSIYKRVLILLAAISILGACERETDGLSAPEYPNNPYVFIDGFSPGLNYAAFGGSVLTAFDVDTEVTYNKSGASMRFEVPDFNDPRGAYAGGVFFTDTGRNLSEYNALTFWAKASQPATIDIIGFGNDLGESKYQVSVSGLKVNSNWQKFILLIPDPSKLKAERGMFFYSEGPENERGYTFWIDEVKFEKLGTISHKRFAIMNGENSSISAETGETLTLSGLKAIANLPTGIDMEVDITNHYFVFESSDVSVATVDDMGVVSVLGPGTATITARVGDIIAMGSLKISSVGLTPKPSAPAPTPDKPADKVISLYSNAYSNVPVDTWNTQWLYSTAEEFFIQIQGDDVIRYKNLNFVGIEFSSSQIDIRPMTHFHIDLWTPDPTSPPRQFKILLVDFGPNGTFGGGDDTSHELTFTAPLLKTGSWVSIDIPLANFSGLLNRKNLAQFVLSGDLPNLYIDNVFFYSNGNSGPSSPTVPAPVPTYSVSDVISVFSDSYTNIPGTNLNPNWGQATIVTEVKIEGNNTLKYSGLNYQGIQLGSNQNISGMSFLHLDFWTTNSTTLKVFIISPGPVETPYSLNVPTNGWSSLDIPLTAFAPVDLSNVFQLKFEGNGEVYLDNIIFRK